MGTSSLLPRSQPWPGGLPRALRQQEEGVRPQPRVHQELRRQNTPSPPVPGSRCRVSPASPAVLRVFPFLGILKVSGGLGTIWKGQRASYQCMCVCEERLLLREPLPCNPSAEPALQPLLRKPSAQEPFFFGGVFCSHTHTFTRIIANLAGWRNPQRYIQRCRLSEAASK